MRKVLIGAVLVWFMAAGLWAVSRPVQWYKLWGFSMVPTIESGAWVQVDKRVPIEDLVVGDVLVYKDLRTRELVCHRVVTRRGVDLLVVKGDNNRFRDRQLVGRNSYVGRVRDFKNVRKTQGRF